MRQSAKLESLEGFIHFVTRSSRDAGFSDKRVQEIELAVEEALVNIINYAYRDREDGEVEITCGLDGEGRYIVEIRDSGVPFDVTAQSDPDLNPNIAERKIGGLGIFLIRKMADEMQYKREGEQNVLTLVILKPPE